MNASNYFPKPSKGVAVTASYACQVLNFYSCKELPPRSVPLPINPTVVLTLLLLFILSPPKISQGFPAARTTQLAPAHAILARMALLAIRI